ncbi:protein-export chaperone SecB [Qingshengfaniella alkalisoli]|uniref:Protein-export protein SecB n=1 Tax=Qingshengfaniella alkalisoli TaxID=2599296 RepID=A0A5B8IYK9_9RHOB|nr:protein-export chaperone SecB [Qingshengfaniella alkalisoli]QDY69981.1 protein-export chaperone SecB [Qingshengfaniella alkalisoli]
MAEETNGADAQQQQARPQMRVLAQFIRDLSFENIMIQKGVQGEVKPQVQVQVSLDAKKRPADNQYEITSKYIVSSKNSESDSTLFHVELDYGGVFHVEGVPENQLHPFLLIECPRMLFPFVRRIIADVTRDGGFPPVNLDTVDFVQLYQQEVARRAQQQGEQKPERVS